MENKEKPYNRLVLIGNGFDLAFGLKTSYSDFILDYLKKEAIIALNNEVNSSNSLVNIVTEKINDPERIKILTAYLNKHENIEELIKYVKKIATISFQYKFFENIVIEHYNANWVDIEGHYYRNLLKQLDDHRNRHWSLKEMLELNKCMDLLTTALNNYIERQQPTDWGIYSKTPLNSLMFKILKPLDRDRLRIIGRHNRKSPPNNVLFLNFNYTNTIQRLMVGLDYEKDVRHIYIHGTVNDANNPIIFGYGDDTGKEYYELESEKENEWLRKIKSFQYPRTTNYHNLLNFIENGEFDVFVIGHSCGLSDGTLLKTIFEHDNCLAIQNFHYQGEEEDFYKRMEISRHFTDKIKMRARLLPFDENARIPQS